MLVGVEEGHCLSVSSQGFELPDEQFIFQEVSGRGMHNQEVQEGGGSREANSGTEAGARLTAVEKPALGQQR